MRDVEWRLITTFPSYLVSNAGDVQNRFNGRLMQPLQNSSGAFCVGLTKDRIQHKRSLALLVANTFLQDSRPCEEFDTPINLNGDRRDNRVDNLAWRPRWFATEYFRQFDARHAYKMIGILNTETGEQFANPWEAAKTYGLLYNDVLMSAYDRIPVWPTMQHLCII